MGLKNLDYVFSAGAVALGKADIGPKVSGWFLDPSYNYSLSKGA